MNRKDSQDLKENILTPSPFSISGSKREMNRSTRVVAAAILSLAAFWLAQRLPHGMEPARAAVMVRAAQITEQAIEAVRVERMHSGVGFDLHTDPNRTGLIGPETGPLMTTLGQLEAKRTTTNPNIAGLIVSMLQDAGVRAGDKIAVGSSGSFPALLVASLAAAKAMSLRPVTILSLGASSYGATDPGFTLLDLYELLLRERICSVRAAGVSLGGEQDIGIEFQTEVRDRLIRKIQDSSVPFLYQSDLVKNVAERMRMYESAAPGRIAAFINSGGGDANIGTSRLVLDLRPGLVLAPALPPVPERGVLFEAAARGIPVIHLLYVKGLAMQAGLPWDPIPLPRPAVVRQTGSGPTGGFWLVSAMYFALLLLLIAYPD